MILLMNVLVTEKGLTHYERGLLPRHPRPDVLLYSIASLSVIPWTAAHVYLEFDETSDADRDRVVAGIAAMLPDARVTLGRLAHQRDWQRAVERLGTTLLLADGLVRHPPEAAGASVLPLAHIDGDGLVGWIDAPAALRTGTMDLLLLTPEQAVPYLLGTPDKALCFLVPSGGGQHPWLSWPRCHCCGRTCRRCWRRPIRGSRGAT